MIDTNSLSLKEYAKALAAWTKIEKNPSVDALRRICIFGNDRLFACLPECPVFEWLNGKWEHISISHQQIEKTFLQPRIYSNNNESLTEKPQ